MSPRALLAWSWTLVILVLCWLPRRYFPEGERLPRTIFVPNFDKIVHMGIFVVFAFLWMRVDRAADQTRRVLVAGLALAFISELGQELPIVRRDANVFDWIADSLGVVVGIYAFKLACRYFEKRAPQPEI
jgi:hypothetical protein